MREKTNNLASDQVQRKPGCTVKEDGKRLEILNLECRGIELSLLAKTKALISFAITAKLICAFVFAYADCRFSNVFDTKTCIIKTEQIIYKINLN